MVVFTCQHCGDPVKKPAVEKHYNTKCRFKTPHLTCVDCLKDFSHEDYGSHNQCMTELQRYSAQGSVFKEQKGKKKQEQYIEMIQTILNSKDLILSPKQKRLLEVCSNHNNVPKKPKPFENFVKNVVGHLNCDLNDIHTVFYTIENAWKKKTQPGSSSANENKIQEKETTDLQEITKSVGETNNMTDEEIVGDKTNSDNVKLKKTKNKIKNNKPFDNDDEDQVNEMSLNESIKEGNDEVHNSASKKQKHKRKSLRLVNEDVLNPEREDVSKYVIDSKDENIDDIKENFNKVSKKQLKKQKKYEKYLAELENETNLEKNEISLSKEGEESGDSKKSKKKSKKMKESDNESELVGLTKDKNVDNTKDKVKEESKKNKKRKLDESVVEIPEKKIKDDSEEGVQVSTGAVFNWGDVIIRVLNSRPDKELSLKKLGKKVVNEYQAVKQDHRTYEELLAKFNKKVNKVKGVRVLRDRAKVIE